MNPQLPERLPAQPRVLAAWYPACWSHELRNRPIRRVIWDQPIALWRGASGNVSALADRCPHRAVPLSRGRVVGENVQCAYHGWKLDGSGTVAEVPGLSDPARGPGRCAVAFPVVERQGMVWIWADATRDAEGEPFFFRHADDRSYMTVRRELSARGSLHQMIENALDVPHTAFLHGGLFRTDGARRPIRIVTRRFSDRAEAQYIGEARPGGLAGRLLSPSGGEVTHYDRFILPSIIEVEYRIGDENHIVLNGACSPVSDWETRLFAVVSVRTRLPGWLIRPIVQPVALRIFGQDAVMLDAQTRSIAQVGEERYVSTELDLLGPHVLALLRRAAKGKISADDGPAMTRETEMLV